MSMTYLWHKEYSSRDGSLFDLETVSKETLEDQGWVDSPAKLGVNVWGGEDGAMIPIKAMYDDKKLPGIGGANTAVFIDATSKQIIVEQKQNELLRKKDEESQKIISDLQRIITRNNEQNDDEEGSALRPNVHTPVSHKAVAQMNEAPTPVPVIATPVVVPAPMPAPVQTPPPAPAPAPAPVQVSEAPAPAPVSRKKKEKKQDTYVSEMPADAYDGEPDDNLALDDTSL